MGRHDPLSRTLAVEIVPAPGAGLDEADARDIATAVFEHLPVDRFEFQAVLAASTLRAVAPLTRLAQHAGALRSHRWWNGAWRDVAVYVVDRNSRGASVDAQSNATSPADGHDPLRAAGQPDVLADGEPGDAFAGSHYFDQLAQGALGVALRPMLPSDLGPIFNELLNDPVLSEPFFRFGQVTAENLQQLIGGLWAANVVVDQSSGQALGWLGVHSVSPHLENAAVEVALFERARRRGLVIPSIAVFGASLFAEYPLRKLYFVLARDVHDPITGTATALFELEVVRPSWVVRGGRRLDQRTFALTRERAAVLARFLAGRVDDPTAWRTARLEALDWGPGRVVPRPRD